MTMTGEQIINGIQSIGLETALVRFSAISKANLNDETAHVGRHIINNDLSILEGCKDSHDLFDLLDNKYTYAGLDRDDDCDGLEWVCYDELWDALAQIGKRG